MAHPKNTSVKQGRRICCDRLRIRTDSEAFAETKNKEVSPSISRSRAGRSSGSASSIVQIQRRIDAPYEVFRDCQGMAVALSQRKNLRSSVTEDL